VVVWRGLRDPLTPVAGRPALPAPRACYRGVNVRSDPAIHYSTKLPRSKG